MASKSRFASLLVAALLIPAAAHASLFRAYLSSAGQPGADCSLAHPCRYLPDALSAVAPGGEIWILDSANFNQGPVTVAKSVTILAVPGEVGSIQTIGGSYAMLVQTSGVDVTLRNVVVASNAISPGTWGIFMTAGNSLTVEDSVFADVPQAAIFVQGGARIRVTGTMFRRNGIAIQALDGAVVDVMKCSIIATGGVALASQGTTSGTTTLIKMSDSVIAGRNANGDTGAFAYTNPGALASIFITRSTIFQTAVALDTEGSAGSLIEVSGSMIVRNGQNVVRHGSGVIRSLGNNHISDGVASDIGTLDPLTPR